MKSTSPNSRDLRDDINEFFHGSLREMINSPKTELKAIISQGGDICTLELETHEKLSMLKITINLKVVVGEELLQYLIDEVTRLRRRHKKLKEEAEAKRKIEDEKNRLEAKMKELTISLNQAEEDVAKKTRKVEHLEKQLDEKTNDLQLAEEEILQERTACDELRDELEQAVDDIDQWKKSFEELDASMKEAVYRHAQEIDAKNREITKKDSDLKKYDNIIKKYHSNPISVSESKIRELEVSLKEKDEQVDILQKKNSELKTTTDELMTRNAELSKKLEKIQLELEVCKKSIRKTQTQAINTTPYTPRMASPQPFTSPTYMSPLYQQQVLPASPVIHMPPQVGMPLHPANRALSANPLLVNFSSRPMIPSSISETPILDQQKRKLLEAAKAAEKAKENIPLSGR